jgi:hypothetical protein
MPRSRLPQHPNQRHEPASTHTAYRSPAQARPTSPATTPPPRTETRGGGGEAHGGVCTQARGTMTLWCHAATLECFLSDACGPRRSGGPLVLWRDKGARRRASRHPLLVLAIAPLQHAPASPQLAVVAVAVASSTSTMAPFPDVSRPLRPPAPLTPGRPRLHRAAALRRRGGHVHAPPDRRGRRRLPRPPPRQPQAAGRRRDGHGRHSRLRDALHGLGEHGPLRQQRRLPLPLRQPRVPGGGGCMSSYFSSDASNAGRRAATRRASTSRSRTRPQRVPPSARRSSPTPTPRRQTSR